MNGIFKINEIILDVVVWLPCNRERGEWTYFNFSTLPVLIRYVEVCRASQISDPIARIRRGAHSSRIPAPRISPPRARQPAAGPGGGLAGRPVAPIDDSGDLVRPPAGKGEGDAPLSIEHVGITPGMTDGTARPRPLRPLG